MLQLIDKLDIPLEVQKKIACTSDVTLVAEAKVSSLEYVSIHSRHYMIFKRMLDILIALGALLIIAIPIMKFGVYKICPGLTGMAQIHGRDMMTPADKVCRNVQYLGKFGFWTDVKIVPLIIPKLIGGDGVAEGFKHTTGEKRGIKNENYADCK